MLSGPQAGVAWSARSILTAVVAAGLFLAGVGLVMVVGPTLAPQGTPRQTIDAFDVHLGWTVGMALVVVWTAARLRPSPRPGFWASLALVGAIFYVAMTGGTYVAALYHAASISHTGPPGADSGGWFWGALLVGLVSAVVGSLVGASILRRAGRLDGRAIGLGMCLGGLALVGVGVM